MSRQAAQQPLEGSSGQEDRPTEDAPWTRRSKWRIDLLLVTALFVAAFMLRYAHDGGDFWSDEADYALASAHGFAANRWDRSTAAKDPDQLIRMRHYHPPMGVQLMGLAGYVSLSDRILRLPFVAAGSLAVVLVFLCGLALFDGRRDVSLACAIIVAVTPLQIRAASHAIPWALITLGLMALLLALLAYVRTKRSGWIVSVWAVLGWLFTTSESFFPILLAAGLSAPILLWPIRRDRSKLLQFLRACAIGICAALLIVVFFWPAGLFGDAWTSIAHYMSVPPDADVARVGDRIYRPVPRWAYVHWYALDYKPYFVLYVLGALTVAAQLACRKLSPGGGVLTVFTLVELTVAHKAIIPGPQYLAHCLPLLTLMTGLCFLALARIARIYAWIVMVGICLYLLLWHTRTDLVDTDQEAQIPRWPAAARFLAARWQPGDNLVVGPQPCVVAQWYLLHYAGIKATPKQIVELPSGHAPQTGLRQQLLRGMVRYVVISDTFTGAPQIDAGVRQIISAWPVIWRSDEYGREAPRLSVYERPNASPSLPALPQRRRRESRVRASIESH